MYNPTIGVWDQVDPLGDHPNQVGISSYAFLNNNPLRFIDPDGRLPIPIVPMLIGGAIGGSVDYAFQVAGNFAKGNGISSFTNNIDRNSIGISAAAGFATVGMSAFGAKVAQVGITTGIDAAESVAKQLRVTASQTVSDLVSNKIGGALVGKLGIEINTKPLARDADRTARISANDPASSGRAATANASQSKLNNANAYNQATSGVAGNAIQNASNASRNDMKSNPIYRNLGVAPADATKNIKPLIFIR